MAGNCRQCPQFSYFNLQNPKSWARNREKRLREVFLTASNRRGFVIIWSPSSHLQDISPHGWPAHISAIFELIRATLIPTLGLFECPLSELACQIGANSAWFVQFDPKFLIPHTLSKFAPCSYFFPSAKLAYTISLSWKWFHYDYIGGVHIILLQGALGKHIFSNQHRLLYWLTFYLSILRIFFHNSIFLVPWSGEG